MKYKTFIRSRKIKDIERKIEKTYKKITIDYWKIGKKELLFKAEG